MIHNFCHMEPGSIYHFLNSCWAASTGFQAPRLFWGHRCEPANAPSAGPPRTSPLQCHARPCTHLFILLAEGVTPPPPKGHISAPHRSFFLKSQFSLTRQNRGKSEANKKREEAKLYSRSKGLEWYHKFDDFKNHAQKLDYFVIAVVHPWTFALLLLDDPASLLPPYNWSWEKMTHEHPLQQLSWHQKRRKLRTLQKCTFTTTFTYNFQGAPEAMKRRNAGSKSLLKFRSHREEQSHRAFSWAGYPMKAKGLFLLQVRMVKPRKCSDLQGGNVTLRKTTSQLFHGV